MERVRDPECGLDQYEDNQTFKNEVHDADTSEMLLKLVHPKLKLQRIVKTEEIKDFKLKENVEEKNDDTNILIHSKEKLEYVIFNSSSSLSCLTLSVISLSVWVLFFV